MFKTPLSSILDFSHPTRPVYHKWPILASEFLTGFSWGFPNKNGGRTLKCPPPPF